MKIAICQTNPIVGDFTHNISQITQAADRAKKAGALLAIFPEMSLPGYPPQDLLEKPSFVRENLFQLDELSSRVHGISILCGYVDWSPSNTGKALSNNAALIADGRIKAKGGKRLLPTYDVYDETRYFEPAPESLLFDLRGRKWGVTLCEDIWNAAQFSGKPHYALDPVKDLMARGAEMLVNLSASPFSLKKGPLRLGILKTIARKYRVPMIYCNQSGGNDDLLFDGASMVVDERGRLIWMGNQFSPDLFIWERERPYEEITDPWLPEEEALLKGLITGTRDYASKCGFKKALLGLSGGLDSSLVAFIAQQALGPENIMGVSMPSSYTSRMSRDDARRLAENLGIDFREIPIHDLYDTYQKALAPLFHELEPDVTEENIQARIRGNLLMALSNKFKALLLATGNKSELAVGYCTLYGDMCGGLAVISDVPKTLCYRLGRYINRDHEIIPQRVLSRPPSAELRPGQTDQDTLPPYEVLDDILDASIESNLGPDDIAARGHDPGMVQGVLRRIAFNEYKRRQAPPGLKLTTKAFGFGRRYPIARGSEVF